MEILIKHGADVNKQDILGCTPLIYAALSNKPEITKLLLKYGADPSIKDKDGKTALDYAKMLYNNKAQIIKLLTGEK